MNDEEIARLFLEGAQAGESVQDMLDNDSRMNIGVDPEKSLIILTIGDEWESMDAEFAQLVSDALLMAVKTINAFDNARYN